MAGPVLTRGLTNFQRQLNTAFPLRVLPDGWIGNQAHKLHTSGHNADDTAGSKPAWNGDPDATPEVRALDLSAKFGDGVTGLILVNHLIGLRNLGQVIRYLIHMGKIWHVNAGFAPAPYAGDNPHTEHVHAEGAWTQAGDNNSTFDFRLEDIPVALNSADRAFITSIIDDVVDRAAEKVWGHRFPRVDLQAGQTPTVSAGALLQFSEHTVNDAADRVIVALQDNAPPPPPPAG